MKNTLFTFLCFFIVTSTFSQNNFWKASGNTNGRSTNARSQAPDSFENFELDFDAFRNALNGANTRGATSIQNDLIMAFPTHDGSLENFKIMEASVLHPELEAKYPGIKSYAGQGIEDPTATIRFSISGQKGLHAMILSGKKSTNFIDPVTMDHRLYRVYKRSAMPMPSGFECLTDQTGYAPSKDTGVTQKTDDKKLRKYRLALSCTAEYGNIFAGSGSDAQKTANILAQMNVTMTRVNGVYEKDLAITMEIIPNNDQVIYFGNTGDDPWTNEYNNRTQQVLDQDIGNANYDIGHNFNTTGGGNAGCIGCVCATGSKGSAYTGRPNPTGDPFDIDYVAHEIGHQFGGYHTMNTCSRSGSGNTEVEPASGSTIMGYAGICSTNVQNNSDDYFTYVNIRDISANIKNGTSSGCAEIIDLANNAPVANAGPNYTIPRSTPFVLRGQGSDADGDALTYTWEQNDPERAPGNGTPQSTWTQGPLFRSLKGTSSPDRYMPKISDVVNGNLSPTWEVIPSVARTMEFALTVRDNKAGGGQTDDDLMNITVSGSAGPFVVSAPNTGVTWSAGQAQTVTWNTAGTNNAPVNCANVNILLSIDGGFTYPITLLANTPNDGSQSITVPNNQSSNCRVMVEAADNIFYDISNTDFTIQGAVSCTPSIPTGLASSNVGSTNANLSWDAVSGATYDLRYRVSGTTTWTIIPASSTVVTVSGLTPATTYESQVRSVCSNDNSAYSSSVTFTTSTSQIQYCDSNGNIVSDEYISNVTLGDINNDSDGSTGGYDDFTALSTDLAKGGSYTIFVSPTWTGTVYNEAYSVWIDFNQDGDFTDSGEQVWTQGNTQDTQVSGNFTVAAGAPEGSTRMRVSMKYNGIPTSCESFQYGEVEDYTVNIVGGTPPTGCAGGISAFPYNEGFENTLGAWTQSNSDDINWSVDANGTPSNATGPSNALEGSYYIYVEASGNGNGYPNKQAILNSPCFDLGNVSSATFSFSYHMYGASDMGNILLQASNDNGGSWTNLWSQTGNQGNVWNSVDINLNPYVGSSVQLRFNRTTGTTWQADIALDGIALSTDNAIGSGISRNEILGFAVYPNPAEDQLNINLPGKEIISLQILTMNGIEIQNIKGFEGSSLDVSRLNGGSYLLLIQTGDDVIHTKFMKK